MIHIATDGAGKGNPGPGGWGVAIFDDEDDLLETGRGGSKSTTNNRMELTAFIMACEDILAGYMDEDITFHIDSTYVLKGVTEWLDGWIRKDFKNVKNRDLWERVESYRYVWKDCAFLWVKGHSGDRYNEAADTLANEGYKGLL